MGVFGLCCGIFGLARDGDVRFRAVVGEPPEAVEHCAPSCDGPSLQSPASSPESRKLCPESFLGDDAVVDLLDADDLWDMLEAFSGSPLAFSQAIRLLGVSEPPGAVLDRESGGWALLGLVECVVEAGRDGACEALTGRCNRLGGLKIRGRGGCFSWEYRGGSWGCSCLLMCGCVCDL